jgi:nucleoside-diphosphate-sugar epimerase
MKSHRALVSGSTGFVGSRLVEHLAAQGWAVARLLRRDLESPEPLAGVSDHSWDGSTASACEAAAAAEPDVVFHLASLFVAEHAAHDVAPLIGANLLVGTQIAEAALRCGCRGLVNAGTSWQYRADRTYEPVCLYAATKQAFEDLLAYYVAAEGFHVVTLRLYDTYGPHDPRPKLLAALRRCADSGIALALSPGEQLLDLVHVDDVARAFALAGERALSGAAALESFDVSSARRIALKEVVALYGEAIGRPVPVAWGRRAYRRREVMVPPPGRGMPGWTPTISLERGLATMAVTHAD